MRYIVEHGCRVTVVTKDVLEHANTRYAQGGIAGVMFADDRVEDHIRDTLVAGAGLSEERAALIDDGFLLERAVLDRHLHRFAS